MSDSIKFLGTSDGHPSPDRHHASLLLKFADATLLLDCGEPCSHTLKHAGVDFNSIDAVFVTHTHSDHVGGLPMLIQSMWLEQRTRPLPIWLPRRAITPLRQWLRTCYLFEPLFQFRLQWKPITEKKVVRFGNVRVSPRRTSHLDSTRAQFGKRFPTVGFDAYSLLVESVSKRIVYSGDIGDPEDLTPLLDKPVDVLVVELAHCHPDKMLRFLSSRSIRHVVFTHLSRQLRQDLPALHRKATKALRPGKVTLAEDGAVIRF